MPPSSLPPNESSSSRLQDSSHYSPTPNNPSSPYTPLRASVLVTATAMDYDPTTMVERGVMWADDQDPFAHVTNTAFPHFLSMCNFRVVEGFEQWLGEEEYGHMVAGKGVGPLVRKYEISIRKVVKYPDSMGFSFPTVLGGVFPFSFSFGNTES